MSNDIDDLGGGPSPEGRRGGSAGTGEFMEARATIHREDGQIQSARLEVSAHNFRRGPEVTLVGALREADVDLDEVERIEVEVGGETLTLKQTGWGGGGVRAPGQGRPSFAPHATDTTGAGTGG